jgi:hypothetical protein
VLCWNLNLLIRYIWTGGSSVQTITTRNPAFDECQNTQWRYEYTRWSVSHVLHLTKDRYSVKSYLSSVSVGFVECCIWHSAKTIWKKKHWHPSGLGHVTATTDTPSRRAIVQAGRRWCSRSSTSAGATQQQQGGARTHCRRREGRDQLLEGAQGRAGAMAPARRMRGGTTIASGLLPIGARGHASARVPALPPPLVASLGRSSRLRPCRGWSTLKAVLLPRLASAGWDREWVWWGREREWEGGKKTDGG